MWISRVVTIKSNKKEKIRRQFCRVHLPFFLLLPCPQLITSTSSHPSIWFPKPFILFQFSILILSNHSFFPFTKIPTTLNPPTFYQSSIDCHQSYWIRIPNCLHFPNCDKQDQELNWVVFLHPIKKNRNWVCKASAVRAHSVCSCSLWIIRH